MTYAEITTEDELQALLGRPMPRAVGKERALLHDIDRQWLAASPFLLMATSAQDGSCDVSPKGDPPGFTYVIDDKTIAIPDRPGNKRVDGFRNILENPHVGLLFFVPGRTETLRINGRAKLLSEAPFFDEMIVKGNRPKVALIVEIEQIFFHCAKSFLRSSLWKPETWQPDVLPSHACIVKAIQNTDETLEELETYYGPSYLERLYQN